MNARATDYIQIADYQDGAAECFAAMGSSAAPSFSTSISLPGTTPETPPETTPDKIPDDLQKWIDTMATTIDKIAPWIDSAADIAEYNWDQEKANPQDDTNERGATRDVPAIPAPVLKPVTEPPLIPRDAATLLRLYLAASVGGTSPASGATAVAAYLLTSYGVGWFAGLFRKKQETGDDLAEFKAELLDAINALAYQEMSVQAGRSVRIDVKSGVLKYF